MKEKCSEKRKFKKPCLEIIKFDADDVIQTSGGECLTVCHVVCEHTTPQ